MVFIDLRLQLEGVDRSLGKANARLDRIEQLLGIAPDRPDAVTLARLGRQSSDEVELANAVESESRSIGELEWTDRDPDDERSPL